ncbi:hypothetical protein ABEI56_23075 [Peribacillus castrilensis]|uniref:hypothetical protein n=1 Tax=Peribacillus castrilensis TaxID=2897690 RepID=UPI003D2B16F0
MAINKGWVLLALSFLCLTFGVQLYNAGLDYQNVIIPADMDVFPVSVFNIRVGEASTTHGLEAYGDIFFMLIPIPLLLAAIFYKYAKN